MNHTLTCLDRLVRNMRLRDLAWMVRFEELLTNVYVLDTSVPAAVYAYHPCVGELPWPVILSLGSFSKKHIHEPRRLVIAEITDRCLADILKRHQNN